MGSLTHGTCPAIDDLDLDDDDDLLDTCQGIDDEDHSSACFFGRQNGR